MIATAEAPNVVTIAEISVVGGMLRSPDVIPTIAETLQAGDFTADRYRRVFDAILSLWQDQEPVDELTAVNRLRERGDLDAAGGMAAVFELTTQVPTAANIEYHARIVRRSGARRRLAAIGAQIQELAASAGEESAEELQAEAERLLTGASPKTAGTGLEKASRILPESVEYLETITQKANGPLGPTTGLGTLDRKLGPLEPGTFVLVAGRPSMGKSSLAVCNIAADVSIRQRRNVALFSIETPRRGVVNRLIGSEGRINIAAARQRRDFVDEEYPRMHQVTAAINTAPLYIDHTPGLTVDQLRVKLRRAIHAYGPIEVVIVDYLQLMSAPKAKSRYDEVSAISTGLARIAKEFECVLIAASQLSRAVEQRPDKKPMMSDLRESGTLEQDADVVLLLYRPEYYHGATMKAGSGRDVQEVNVEGKAEIIIAKVRDGETGSAVVGFDKTYTHFHDLT